MENERKKLGEKKMADWCVSLVSGKEKWGRKGKRKRGEGWGSGCLDVGTYGGRLG